MTTNKYKFYLILFQEKCNAINGLCNKLAKVRVKAKKTKENVQFWEALVTEIKTFIADKTLEHEMVRGLKIYVEDLNFADRAKTNFILCTLVRIILLILFQMRT